MTTLAWDGKLLAADSQVTQNSHIITHGTKIFKTDDYILAFCGSFDEGYAFKDVIEGEIKMKDISFGKDFTAVVWYSHGEIFEYYDTGLPIPITEKFAAYGSGASIALTAMVCGKTAHEAIELAKKLDIYTGGKVISYGWEPTKKGKKKKNGQLSTSNIQEQVREIPAGTEQAGGMGRDSQEIHGLPAKTSRIFRFRTL